MTKLRRLYKTVTATGTTAAGTIGTIRGRVVKIQVLNDTGSCGWWIFQDASDNTAGDGNIVDENLLGATGAGHVDTAGATYYPVVAQVVGSTAATTDPDQFDYPLVDGQLEYDVDDCANTEVLSICIWYIPI